MSIYRLYPASLIFLLLSCLNVFSQPNPILKVHEYVLDNGFKISLNYDSTATNVFGAVLVNAGSKHESPDATGMAHYLEHLLFKGTDKLGTTNFELEKIHIDSITFLYDLLARTSDKAQKDNLLRKINQQAIKASKYGLPNEFDKLLREIGGTGINAFTNKEITFYHNSFPGNELEKWMSLYAERFRNPIFRSFQTELEVVYEEKNRALDNLQTKIFDETLKLVYPNHPYGQWSTLGSVEHLKNPSISKMQAFFNKYYVANNMALILSGNFNLQEALWLAKKYFGTLKSDPNLNTRVQPPDPIVGNPTTKRRITPVKVALLSYQTPPSNHPDRPVFDVIEYMLFNEGETGLLNKIQLRNEMLYVGSFGTIQNESSVLSVFYVPKIIGQSLRRAEEKVKNEINRLKTGDFDVSFLSSAKSEIGIDFQKSLENNESRGIKIGEAINMGNTWIETLSYPSKISSVTKNDIIRVANHYFGENYAKLVSRTGFGKKNKLSKPSFKAVKNEQKGISEFGHTWELIETAKAKERFVDFNTDIDVLDKNTHSIYATKNPVNSLFYLTINFHKGIVKEPKLSVAAQCMNYAATNDKNIEQLKLAFSEIGCTYFFSASSNYSTVTLEGEEQNLAKALALLNDLIKDGKTDKTTKDLVFNSIKTERKLEGRSPSAIGTALFWYGALGQLSYYVSRESLKNIKETDASEYISLYKSIAKDYKMDILFSGSTSAQKLNELFRTTFSLSGNLKSDPLNPMIGRDITENVIYIVNDKKAVQSQIYFYVKGEKYPRAEYGLKNAFNEYFGGGFSGLAMQEIREYRSLAYSTGGNYSPSIVDEMPGSFYGYIGCQADKSNEAIEVMQNLVTNMPVKKEREDMLQKSLKMAINTNFPNFKTLPLTVRGWRTMGYTQDPNREASILYNDIGMEVINQFYQKHIKGKPYIITIYGDLKRMDIQRLSKFGKIVRLERKEFFVE